MKLTLSFFFCSFFILAQAQNKIDSVVKQSRSSLAEGNVYLFCRGTTTKAGIVSNGFNQRDKNVSHVGIGYIENNKTSIYHVSDITDTSKSALFVDSIHSFISVPNISYFSIWVYNKKQDFLKFKRVCQKYKNKKILFDFKFEINNDALYCSELCVSILNEISKFFSIKPIKILLQDNLYKLLLKRKEFIYYPADFFAGHKDFKKIFEIKL